MLLDSVAQHSTAQHSSDEGMETSEAVRESRLPLAVAIKLPSNCHQLAPSGRVGKVEEGGARCQVRASVGGICRGLLAFAAWRNSK
jgi:hypothetical protein